MRTASSGRARRSRPAVVALLSALLLAVPLTAAADEGGSDADDPVGGAEQAAPETGAPLGVYDCNWEVYADLTLNSDVTCDGGDDYWVLVASSGVVIDLNGHTVDLGASDWSSTGAGIVLDATAAVGGTLEDVTIRNGTIRGVAN
ncbi:MAG: hypothetical protein RLZZ272_379, partial [Actinomycetota bacterium]